MAMIRIPIERRDDLVRVVRCKDCKYQRKIWHSDKRRKDGGYTIYICDACEYAPLGYDTDYCSYGERRDDERID